MSKNRRATVEVFLDFPPEVRDLACGVILCVQDNDDLNRVGRCSSMY